MRRASFLRLSLTEAAAALQARELTAQDALEQTLDIVREVEPAVHAYAITDPPGARRRAQLADSEMTGQQGTGPLHGIPFGIKDLIDTGDLPTSYGCDHFTGFQPQRDADVVRALRSAGAVVVGKTVTDELALDVFSPPARNPWDIDRIPGGSSGGSAAAVAARECFGALGTDTGGSVRIPASMCGVVGLKPTLNALPMTGVMPLSKTLDHVGLFARTVGDAELILHALTWSSAAGAAPPGQRSRPPDAPGYRLAVLEDLDELLLDPEVRRAVQSAVASVREAGVSCVPMPGRFFTEASRHAAVIEFAESHFQHRDLLLPGPSGASASAKAILRKGAAISASDYLGAMAGRQAVIRDITDFARREGISAFVSPTLPVTATPADAKQVAMPGQRQVGVDELCVTFCRLANLTGWPAISVPCGFDAAGLPIGVQLMSPPRTEARLLEVARAFEVAAGLLSALAMPPVLASMDD